MPERRDIRRLFVANRGEIAVRVVRAAKKLGIASVVGVSSADRDTLAAKLADRAVCIGPPPSRLSYLDIPVVIAAARGTGCDAVHPGYGFLSERADFAEACAKHDLVFVGPRPEAIRAAGDKLEARRIAERLGVPLAAGSNEIESAAQAKSAAAKVGLPILLKAAAGGGGRGMRVVRRLADLAAHFEQASAEARQAFGDGRLFLERFVGDARHVEVQVLGDRHGTLVHLFERDCSLQRRHQKITEEAPAPGLSRETRQALLDAATAFASAIGYDNAGTVEFLFDAAADRFYFLEMNSRIQVEHPVTEESTGIDLVAEQIRIAAGERISFTQRSLRTSGHAIECRVNVEDPDRDFMPSPGRITRWSVPRADDIRIDSHAFAGYLVPPFYDSLLAKVIVRGADRSAAIQRMEHVLALFDADGVKTNVPFHRFVLAHPDFRQGAVSTRWIESKGYAAFREEKGLEPVEDRSHRSRSTFQRTEVA
jgi:acetyl-CoA carboxylase biotin carboxylase subunit